MKLLLSEAGPTFLYKTNLALLSKYILWTEYFLHNYQLC